MPVETDKILIKIRILKWNFRIEMTKVHTCQSTCPCFKPDTHLKTGVPVKNNSLKL